MKVYYSHQCPDCTGIKDELEKRQYKIIDISESMINLKEFLRLRDSRDEFQAVKEKGNVGIPAFLDEDDKIYFSLEDI